METDSEHSSAGHTARQTRERLLDVAEQLFAARGYAGTSVRVITQAAGCNLAAVNYHFGSKHGLYEAVFRGRLGVLREQRLASIRAARSSGTEPVLETVLTAFAGTFLEPLVDASRGRVLTELLAREMLDPQLPPELFANEITGPVQGSLMEALRAAVPGLSADAARLCVMSVVAQLVQSAHRVRLAQVEKVARPPLPPLAEVVEHIVRFSAAGVLAVAAPMRGKKEGGA